jgi:4,5-dihydroxyphthalate decarboxylase
MENVLSIAMSKSDRTNGILTGEAHLPSFRFETKSTMVEEIFVKQASEACFDISEHSLASYLIALDRGETRLTAIPVFLSRSFRHNAIYVRSDSTWKHPSELRHRRFGFPEYQMTAAVWVRAYLRHEWGIAADDIDWVTFRPERIPIEIPAERSSSDDIFDALVSGEVDAIMSARRPPERYFPLSGEGGKIRRLIPEVWNVEREYYNNTGFFPIMHLVSLKKETVENYPNLPKQLYDLMLEVKDKSVSNLFETVKNGTSIPFLWEAAEKSAHLLDSDVWPYGLSSNWNQIQTFIQYLKEDGLIKNDLSKDQVFASGVLDT